MSRELECESIFDCNECKTKFNCHTFNVICKLIFEHFAPYWILYSGRTRGLERLQQSHEKWRSRGSPHAIRNQSRNHSKHIAAVGGFVFEFSGLECGGCWSRQRCFCSSIDSPQWKTSGDFSSPPGNCVRPRFIFGVPPCERCFRL
jgi:hypothetical protein